SVTHSLTSSIRFAFSMVCLTVLSAKGFSLGFSLLCILYLAAQAEEDEWRVIFSCQSSRTCWNVAGLSDIVQGGTEVGKEEQYKEERNWQVGTEVGSSGCCTGVGVMAEPLQLCSVEDEDEDEWHILFAREASQGYWERADLTRVPQQCLQNFASVPPLAGKPAEYQLSKGRPVGFLKTMQFARVTEALTM
ncbi:hypothetical protein L195_g022032, partial [Trifolium pratense]